MAKASRSKQPAFDPSELEDLIHSPAVGRGVGSHLLTKTADFPALWTEAAPVKKQSDLSTVATLPINIGGLAKLNPSILKLPEPQDILTSDMSTVDTSIRPTVVRSNATENKDSNGLHLPTVDIIPTVDMSRIAEAVPALTFHLTTVDTLNNEPISCSQQLDPSTVVRSTWPTVDTSISEQQTAKNNLNLPTVDRFGKPTVDRSNVNAGRFSPKVKLWITEQGELIPEGRVKRIRLAQDVINSGEELVYDTLWAVKGSADSDTSRVVQAGYDYLVKRTRLAKKTIQRIIAKLIDKDFIVIEVPADIYQRTSTVYRVFNYKAVLDRNIQRGRTHVAKVGPGFSYVRPLTTSDLSTVDISGMSTVANKTTVTGDEKDLSTVVNETTLPIDKKPLDQVTTTVTAALGEYGMADDDAVSNLIRRCRQECQDCTADELVHFIHQKGKLAKGKGSGITNPIGFLIDAVPKCFAGGAFMMWRQSRSEHEVTLTEVDQADRDLVWGREHEAELNDPNVPEEIKRVIRRCLGA